MSTDSAMLNEARNILRQLGHTIVEEKRVNDAALQLRTKAGPVVNLWDNGNCTVQGKDVEDIRSAVAHLGKKASASPAPPPRTVFVVYGHDASAKEQLEAMLRRWDLEPIFLDQLPSQGQTLIEKLEQHRSQASYAVVLATPDDEGHAVGREDEKNFRARQNVVLELGMMLAMLGRANVAILYKGPMELPSDITGLVYIPFTDNVADARIQLAKEFDKAGFSINVGKF